MIKDDQRTSSPLTPNLLLASRERAKFMRTPPTRLSHKESQSFDKRQKISFEHDDISPNSESQVVRVTLSPHPSISSIPHPSKCHHKPPTRLWKQRAIQPPFRTRQQPVSPKDRLGTWQSLPSKEGKAQAVPSHSTGPRRVQAESQLLQTLAEAPAQQLKRKTRRGQKSKNKVQSS